MSIYKERLVNGILNYVNVNEHDRDDITKHMESDDWLWESSM